MYKSSYISQILILAGLLLFPLLTKSQTRSIWASPIEKCWTYKTKNLSELGIVSNSKSAAIILSTSARLEAIDIKKGKKLWSTKLGGSYSSPLLINNQYLYVINRMSMPLGYQIISIDLESGINRWQKVLNKQINPGRLTSNFNLLFTVSGNGHITTIDRVTKSIVWKKSLNAKVTSNLVADDSNLILGTSKNIIAIISKQNGDILFQIPVKKTPTRMFLAFNGKLLVGDKQGNVRAYNLSGRKKKRGKLLVRTGGEIVGMFPLKDSFLIISKDNFVYSASLRNGRKIWKRKFSGRVTRSLLLDKGAGAFISSGSNNVVFISLSNGKVINQLSLEKGEYFTGHPLATKRLLLLPTNNGLTAYSSTSCKE